MTTIIMSHSTHSHITYGNIGALPVIKLNSLTIYCNIIKWLINNFQYRVVICINCKCSISTIIYGISQLSLFENVSPICMLVIVSTVSKRFQRHSIRLSLL